MKRLWIAVAILASVFAATLFNSAYLHRFTAGLTDRLELAEEKAEAGDWTAAGNLTKEALALWDGRAGYLHTVLRHADIDGVHIGFQEVLEFISCEEGGEYSAANASLTTQIGLLYEMEQFSLQNLL